MEFVFKGIIRIKVANRWWAHCLQYDCIDKDGCLYQNGLFSLNKKWMRPCSTTNLISKWCRVSYDAEKNRYTISDPHSDNPYSVHEPIIDQVDSLLFEQHVLGCNLKLERSNRKLGGWSAK